MAALVPVFAATVLAGTEGAAQEWVAESNKRNEADSEDQECAEGGHLVLEVVNEGKLVVHIFVSDGPAVEAVVEPPGYVVSNS